MWAASSNWKAANNPHTYTLLNDPVTGKELDYLHDVINQMYKKANEPLTLNIATVTTSSETEVKIIMVRRET